MSEFSRLQQGLSDARAAHQAAESALLHAREQAKRAGAHLGTLARSAAPGDARLAQAGKARTAADAGVAEASAKLASAATAQAAAAAAFARVSDPREAVEHLTDLHPFLLFPLRLETRFREVVEGWVVRHQLWVRVYPDDCSIDTFEPTLTDAEVRAAAAYWTGMWRAGGVEAGERAAWRDLVAGHGSGRAAWIVQRYRPVNEAARPKKGAETDVVLVVATETPLAAAERGAAADYWVAMWRGAGSDAQQAAAFAALVQAVGGEARARAVVEGWRPANLAEAPAAPVTRATAVVSTAFLVLPPAGEQDTRTQSWSRAPRVAAFPDRFVLIAYPAAGAPVVMLGEPVPSPLVAGPDPNADPDAQLRQEGADLVVPDEMRWMVDFDRAVEVGMGFRVPLTSDQAQDGFERLLVLGIRASEDAQGAAEALETLFAHHQAGRGGFALVPQGTPTNNTEGEGAGFTRGDDPDASFELQRGSPRFTPTGDRRVRRDGEWLARWLGIAPSALARTPHADGGDQADARAMNEALWPATLGYWMKTMMDPVFSPAAERDARWFFTRYVSGRGPVPAIRIGAQPYGILPVTAFSRMGWMDALPGIDADRAQFLHVLYGLLEQVREDWAELAKQASFAGKEGDAHQVLLDILGLHPSSVEYAHRWAESAEQTLNRLGLTGLLELLGDIVLAGVKETGTKLLNRLGYAGDVAPEIQDRFFFADPHALKGPAVDDRPPSETEPVRGYTPDGRNYLRWLVDAAESSLDALRREQGFTGGRPPRALLYLLLRQALQLGYQHAGLALHGAAGTLSDEEIRAAVREPPFVHVSGRAAHSESRYHHLYAPAPAITGSPTLTLAEFIAQALPTLAPAAPLWEQLEAVRRLRDVPTARLERALAEHVDLCAYRLDAWILGLVHCQLEGMRNHPAPQPAPTGPGRATPSRGGVHLGAYAWLEGVRPGEHDLSPAAPPADLQEAFSAGPPLMRDAANQGYVHAPSLNQAVTAAVLRNGYLSNATPKNPGTLAVNLTSARVRVALGVLEGIRGGQSLGALLGYRFERGLHDRHAEAEVDVFIHAIRKAFPLAGDRMASTRTGGEVPIEAVEASNVVDGVALAEHAKDGHADFPFGLALPAATPAQAAALEAEVRALLDVSDAVADLAMAEGVFQAVQGNYDRVASTLDAYSRGHFPPEPEVVRTPASGIMLTHRVALHLDAGADPGQSPVAGLPMTPRARAEPALNRWLAGVLPPLGKVGCTVAFRRADTGAPATAGVTLQDLGLQPLDLLHVVRDEAGQAMTELDDRIVSHAAAAFAPRPGAGVEIRYLEALGAPYSVFEVLPLVRALRRLALASRPLRPSDLALANEATQAQDDAVSADGAGVAQARQAMQGARDHLAAFRDALDGPLNDLENRRGEILQGIDDILAQAAARLEEASHFGAAAAGWGFVHDFARRHVAAVLGKVEALVERWGGSLAGFDAELDAWDATPEGERIALLQRAERRISTHPTDPVPATPAAYRAVVDQRRADFAARRAQFAALLAAPPASLRDLTEAVKGLDAGAFDAVGLSVEEEERHEVLFAMDARAIVHAVCAELDQRLATAGKALQDAAQAPAGPARVRALQAAAKAVFGEAFVLLPRFTLRAAQGAEVQQAAGDTDQLLGYLRKDEEVDFPVDDWLYGAARVREPLRAWEELVMLSGAMGAAEPALTPLQLPYAPGDAWLALQFPEERRPTSDRLLYTAHFAAPFAAAAGHCGLLLDEWTEVIPAARATSGLAFHYDRPGSEAPQVMLLVTPTAFTGGWRWDDLVDALNETLDLLRLRAVEPAHLAATPYAPFLPATLMAATPRQVSITGNLARMNLDLVLETP
jgi:hypothetical protein